MQSKQTTPVSLQVPNESKQTETTPIPVNYVSVPEFTPPQPDVILTTTASTSDKPIIVATTVENPVAGQTDTNTSVPQVVSPSLPSQSSLLTQLWGFVQKLIIWINISNKLK